MNTVTVQLAPIIAEAKAELRREYGLQTDAMWSRCQETFRPYIEDVAASKVIGYTTVVKNDYPVSITFEYELPRPHGAPFDVAASCKNCGAPNKGLVACEYCGTHGFYREVSRVA